MFNLRKKKYSSGQALLIILLTLTVVLTVVLSVVSRSVTDISVTTYQEDAQRAFDAAEAGIERALLTGSSQTSTPIGDATFITNISSPLPDGDEAVYPSDVLAGESATFWFVSQDALGDLFCSGDCLTASRIRRICWGQEGTAIDTYTPAIELSVFYDETPPLAVNSGDFSQVKIARRAYDPNSGRIASNNFILAGSCNTALAGRDFAFATDEINLGADLNIPCTSIDGCLLMAKVRLLYNHNSATGVSYPHPIGIEVISGGSHLPAQGTLIDSIGEAGDTTRRVNVFQSYPEPPFVFEAAIFGKGGLSK